ncbi:hypothetical protein [Pontiella sulfatireligans]|uniref:SLA1 homology domain-containing protein n=1 Tax=Pontiella sulfatireligans TaxID=2750658 RepID=A0A6C2UW30_9BACT|nr:hypothetical protein [Pontiella sulfatireligans]VGO23394.1 hypothetical protein SCARR_05501 [Pontiella sulfatireligans]
MKKLILLFTLITLSASAVEYRTFTAQDGRTLKAKVLAYNGTTGQVQIQREDKKKLTVASAAFSKKDQTYIAAWQAALEFMAPGKLKLELKRNEVKSFKKDHEADLSKIKTGRGGERDGIEIIATDKNTQYKFDLQIENKGSVPLNKVTYEYRVYYEQEKPVKDAEDETRRKESGEKDTDERVRYNAVNENKVKDGSARLKPINPKDSKVMSTGIVTILKRTAGKPYQDKINLKGSLAGAWVKLTMKSPDGETLVREVASPASIMKKFPWDPVEEK